jgi:hypothetical protein
VKQNESFPHTPTFLAICAILIASAVTVLGTWLSNASDLKKELRVKNHTTGFELVGLEETNNIVRLKLKNNYERTIIAFGVSEGRVQLSTDLTVGHDQILPGAIYMSEISPQTIEQRQNIVIRSVIFEGGGFDGDSEQAKAIFDMWRGEKKQLARVLPMIVRVLALPESEMPAALEALKSQLSALPEDDANINFKNGLHSVKQITISDIAKIQRAHAEHTDAVSIQEGLGQIKRFHESYLKRILD